MTSFTHEMEEDRPGTGAEPVRVLRLVPARGEANADPNEHLKTLVMAVALEQSREALAALFEQLAPRMKSWLIRSGSSAEAADDLVQETFVVLWRKADRFDTTRTNVTAWLYTIARNLRIDRHRGGRFLSAPLEDEALALLEDPAAGPAQQLLDAERDATVRHALAQLPDDAQKMLRLSFYDEKSHSCIAAELQLPLGTVKTRIRRAAARLRLLLEEYRS